jgi:hypothetical protein
MVGAIASAAVAFATADRAALNTMGWLEVGTVTGCTTEAERDHMINALTTWMSADPAHIGCGEDLEA